jgi:Flp pilus assembly pilin Flp
MDQSKSVPRASAALLSDERGLSTVEYVVILILVAAVAIGSWSMFGHQVKCALGMANDTVAAGIGAESTVGAQACAKGTPRPGGGAEERKEATPDEPKKKTKRAPGT